MGYSFQWSMNKKRRLKMRKSKENIILENSDNLIYAFLIHSFQHFFSNQISLMNEFNQKKKKKLHKSFIYVNEIKNAIIVWKRKYEKLKRYSKDTTYMKKKKKRKKFKYF